VTPLLAAALNNHLPTCLVLLASNCLLDVVGEIKVSAGVHRQFTAAQVAPDRTRRVYSDVEKGRGTELVFGMEASCEFRPILTVSQGNLEA